MRAPHASGRRGCCDAAAVPDEWQVELPDEVRDAFAVTGPVTRLDGGQGTSVEADGLVLKPGADEADTTWFAALCERVPQRGFRLPGPVAARDGRLVVAGWSATRRVVGSPVPDEDRSIPPWLQVLAAGRALHEALRHEPHPPSLARRTDRWASADRVAWGGPVDAPGPRSQELLREYGALVVDEGLPAQLVHGDLSGNVLISATEPPAVIDVSPYWRPARYADAVVVVDACLWWRTDPALLSLARPDGLAAPAWTSLLARAGIFRLLSFDEPSREAAEVEHELPRHRALLAALSDSAS
jgi:uncharacterized protein (TIGR02569 family)